MDCKECCSALYLFFDDELEEDLRIPFNDHIGQCGHCARRMQFTRRLLAIVRESTSVRCCAPERLRIRIRASLSLGRAPESN
jgi:anti-sigma factor (TIGR02949 family)